MGRSATKFRNTDKIAANFENELARIDRKIALQQSVMERCDEDSWEHEQAAKCVNKLNRERREVERKLDEIDGGW